MPDKRLRGAKKNNKGALYQPTMVVSTLLDVGLDSPAATINLGRQLIAQKLPRLWLLRGDLGAGKTTLVRGILRGLGVRRRVTSPTFTLIKIYSVHRRGIQRVVHLDAYRIKHKSELAALDLTAIMADKKTLVLIEWPERLQKKLPGSATLIGLKHRGLTRLVTVRVRLFHLRS